MSNGQPAVYPVGDQNDQPFGAPVPSNMSQYCANNANGGQRQVVQSESINHKLDTVKSWSISTFKCTKQIINEKLGKGSKTVDSELEEKIASLMDTKARYSTLLSQTKSLYSQFTGVVNAQRSLVDTFADLALRQTELASEFSTNGETQKALIRNGDQLILAMRFFIESLNTVVTKTIEDTILTIRKYETSRVEYDAYRTEFETVANAPQSSADIGARDDAMRLYTAHKEKYDQLRADVVVKLQFLDENRTKVMHNQLTLFHNAVVAYFTGNASLLQNTLKQFSIKPRDSAAPSFLEQ